MYPKIPRKKEKKEKHMQIKYKIGWAVLDVWSIFGPKLFCNFLPSILVFKGEYILS